MIEDLIFSGETDFPIKDYDNSQVSVWVKASEDGESPWFNAFYDYENKVWWCENGYTFDPYSWKYVIPPEFIKELNSIKEFVNTEFGTNKEKYKNVIISSELFKYLVKDLIL